MRTLLHRAAAGLGGWPVALLAGGALLLWLLSGDLAHGWIYDRRQVAAGQWWRLVSGHLVHVDGHHLLLNVLGLGMLGGMLAGERRTWLLFLASMAAIDAVLYWGMPPVVAYCGLSGLLHGQLGGWLGIRMKRGDGWAWGVLLVVVGKILYEFTAEAALLAATAWPPLPEAHGVGVLTGVLWGMDVHKKTDRAP